MNPSQVARELERIRESQNGRMAWLPKKRKGNKVQRRKKVAAKNRKRNIRRIQKPFTSKNGKVIYEKYIRSRVWFKRRAEFLKKFPNCIICDEQDQKEITVHHVKYRRKNGESILGTELDSELRTLCKKCHKKIHFFNMEKIFGDGMIIDFWRNEILKLPSVSTHKHGAENVIYGEPDIDLPW